MSQYETFSALGSGVESGRSISFAFCRAKAFHIDLATTQLIEHLIDALAARLVGLRLTYPTDVVIPLAFAEMP